MNAFETWLKNDFPEADLSRLPSGSYRVQSVRDMERAWLAASDRFIGAGWIDAEGYSHTGCPPPGEPKGWITLYEVAP
jgi:hypothetical protein